MKKLMILLTMTLLAAACSDHDGVPAEPPSMGTLSVLLTGTDRPTTCQVLLRNTATGSIFTETADAEGRALFRVTPGIYEATATGSSSADGYAYTYNGTSGQVVVRRNEAATVTIALRSARSSQIIIKELYNGGCMRDNGVDTYHYDKCIVLYNNSAQKASLAGLCIGQATPSNAHSDNLNYGADGRLTYEHEGFIPVWNGIWYFPADVELEPYCQLVVNVHGAIDNTLTVSQSVNYARPDYYCMYDPESGYNHTGYYPTPADVIPTSHYLRAVRYGLGTGWALSTSSPAVVLFRTHDTDPAAFATNADNRWYDGARTGDPVGVCLKVPVEWVADAVEVFSSGYKDSSLKRLTADVDAGYVWLTNYRGHTLYRNVDLAATQALPENDGLLVYGYALGADGDGDPGGIDAEASMQRGAHIVFQDTNNSTNDFHERQRCSLRD